MPATSPQLNSGVENDLDALGAAIRKRRQDLGLSMTQIAAASGISRVTLHRIERGNPSVTIGAYLNAGRALGLRITAGTGGIRVGDYPQLSLIAWNHRPGDLVTEDEALALYERNWRHVDHAALSADELTLIDRLTTLAGHRGRLLV